MDYEEDKKNNICHPEFISGSYQHENNEEILWKTINFSQNNKMLKQVQHDMNVSLKKHIAFTHLVNPLRSDLSPAKQSQSPARSSLTGLRYSRPSGFTLAETLIALTVLGIVAAITVPPLVRRQIEAANRAKLKKVMTVYDFLMNKMTVENNLKSNGAIEEWADDNCQNTSNYFKVVKRSDTPKEGKDYCRFKTADGVWWDIDNIMKPTVALKESELDNSDGKHTFKLLAHFGPNGELRVSDLQWELTQNENLTEQEKEDLKKLYAFVKGERYEDTRSDFAKHCMVDKDDPNKCTLTYNCPTTTEPNRTCEQKFKQLTGVIGQCVDIKYGKLKNTQSCAADGIHDYWVPENPIETKVYGADAATNCEGSTSSDCSSYGDYYNAAKKYCEQIGTHLATLGELKSLGYNEGYFWVAEESSSDDGYVWWDGDADVNGKLNHNDAVCVNSL